MTSVAIVGSRELGRVPVRLVMWMHQLPRPAQVLLRRPLKARAGRFELMVEHVASLLSLPVLWASPEPGGGRRATFARDIEMVARADCVLAFFAGEEMTGGTEHVVEKAIDLGIPVYSFGLRDEELVALGSHDPEDAWGRFTV